MEYATLTDLDGIGADFGRAIQRGNSKLKEQAYSAMSAVALNIVRLLPDDKRHYCLNFLESDALNPRLKFLTSVLPWVCRELKRKRSNGRDDGSPREQAQRQLKRSRCSRQDREMQKP
ncbi:hypothetical protein AJ79_04023 [Helicocarpus griseus UAMH5409]|uniref:Uncharacterized protein n=1 Tax=Helicocarpus griseus UAMH5409 TaxID=1447875 RepID=A0A2B7XV04_9EURO|nr:hypothetical protein AJ79_04023 [Helicocarpus griseus UAMH5409]